MKRFVFIIFILITHNVYAQWISLDDVQDGTNEWYVDTKPTWSGKIVKLWIKINYYPPMVNQLGTTKSSRQLRAFNCKDLTWNTLWLSAFSEYELDGDRIVDLNPKTEWMPVPPNTFSSNITDTYCKK